MSYALVHFDEDGNLTLKHSADVVLLCVDERCPEDRVYCVDNVASDDEFKAIVGLSKIGHLNDQTGNTERARRLIRDEDV